MNKSLIFATAILALAFLLACGAEQAPQDSGASPPEATALPGNTPTAGSAAPAETPTGRTAAQTAPGRSGPSSAQSPLPTETRTAASPGSTPVAPAATPEDTPAAAPMLTPIHGSGAATGPGTLRVGQDIAPGIYAGVTGFSPPEPCYWARLSGDSGSANDVIASADAIGQFYIEVLATDAFLETACELTPLSDLPGLPASPENVHPGTHIVGRDIAAGIYLGNPGRDVRESCHWERLSGVSGDPSQLTASGDAEGLFYVEVESSDFALQSQCTMSLVNSLHSAAFSGTPAEVRELLDLGADVNQVSGFPLPGGAGGVGQTPLHLAAWNNTPEVVGLLLEYGADVNAVVRIETCARGSDEYFTPLMSAMHNADPAMAQLMLDWGAGWEGGALHYAAKVNSVSGAKTLLEQGADIEQMVTSLLVRTAFHFERFDECKDVRSVFTTPLHIAAANDSVDVASLLLDQGADVNSYNRKVLGVQINALHIAAIHDSPGVAALLLEQGADIKSLGRLDGLWRLGTPLHFVAAYSSTDVAALLLDRGADIESTAVPIVNSPMAAGPDPRRSGPTPLQLAAQLKADPAMITLLLNRGADMNPPTGLTPLQLAVSPRYRVAVDHDDQRILKKDAMPPSLDEVMARHLSVIETLLDQGADIEAVRDGVTPLGIAVGGRITEIVELLLDRGAKSNEEICQEARRGGTYTGTPLLGRLCRPG